MSSVIQNWPNYITGHKIPHPSSAPVQSVSEFGEGYTPFLKSVTKHIKILPAANRHCLDAEQIDTPAQIIDIVNENESFDDIFLDLEPEKSYEELQSESLDDSFGFDLDESFEESNINAFPDYDVDMEEGRESNRNELSEDSSNFIQNLFCSNLI